MKQDLKIAIVRGAGLAFPLSCLYYLLSGNPYAFALVVPGAALGFVIGQFLEWNPQLTAKVRNHITYVGTGSAQQHTLMNYFGHSNLLIRFASLMVLGTLLFMLAWYIGYYLLPEAIFHGGAHAHMVRTQLTAASATVFEEWLNILKANLWAALYILLGSLLIRVNGFSFGYLYALFNMIGYGLFVGTNSFAVPYPVRMAPSFEILSRSGPYEMMAWAMLAAATYFWPFFQIRRIFVTGPERVKSSVHFSWKDAVGIALGLGILMVSNWIEAVMVMSA